MRIGKYEFYLERVPAFANRKRPLVFSWRPYLHIGACGCKLAGFLCFGVTRLSQECLNSFGDDSA